MSKRQDIRKLKEEQEYILKKLHTYMEIVSNLTDDVRKLQTPFEYIKGDMVEMADAYNKFRGTVLGVDTSKKGCEHYYLVEKENGTIVSAIKRKLYRIAE